MSYEQKDNTASIFTNDRKTEDKHPDSTGSARIGGVDYYVSAWRRQSKSGKTYLALSFKPKIEAVDKSQPLGAALSDSLPF